MKKLLIFGCVLAATASLAGCSGTNESAVINRLSHQLDRTASTVNSITEDSSSELAMENIAQLLSNKASTSQISALSDAYQSSAKAASGARELSTKINKKITAVKKTIAGNIKLGNENTGSVNDLTSSMQKYTTSLNKTKSDYKNAAKAIYKLGDSESVQLDAKLARLSCCVEARDCYLQNLLLTLENLENILSGLEESDDSLAPATDIQAEQNEMVAPNVQQNNAFVPNAAEQNFAVPQNYNQNYIPNGFNGAAGYGAGYAANPYGYGYGYGYRGGFNPDRNTDTYGPGVTNIDTYKFNGNNRRFQSSNGVTSIEAEQGQDVLEPQKEQPNELIDFQNEQLSQMNESSQEIENFFEQQATQTLPQEQKQALQANQASLPTRPAIKPRKNAQEKQLEAEPESSESEEKDIEEMKVRSVSTDIEENLLPEDKVKGHTQTEADINKKIEKLIKKAVIN